MIIPITILLLYLSYYDIRYYKVPNRILLLLLLFVLFNQCYSGELLSSLLCGLYSILFFTLVYIFSRGKIGMGDIKFSIVSAIYLGYFPWLLSLMIGVLSILPFYRYFGRSKPIPFVPFLTFGTFFSHSLLNRPELT